MSLWFRWGAWCVLNCFFLHRSLSLIPRAPRIRQKKVYLSQGREQTCRLKQRGEGTNQYPIWSIFSKLNPFKTKIKNPPLLIPFHNQNQLKRLSLDRKTRTEHVYMYICKYHHVPSNIIHHVHLYICKYYHTIISSYFSFIIPVAPVYNYANFTPDSKVRFLGKLSAAMDQVALGLQARAFLKSVSNWSRNPFKYCRHTSDRHTVLKKP